MSVGIYDAAINRLHNETKQDLAKIAIFCIPHDSIMLSDIAKHFNYSMSLANHFCELLEERHFIYTCNDDDKDTSDIKFLVATSYDELISHPESHIILKIMDGMGYDEAKVRNLFEGLPVDQKKLVSIILNEDSEWHSTNNELPIPGMNVKIRVYSPEAWYYISKETVNYVEEIAIAQLTNDHGWFIIPPYLAYNFNTVKLIDKDSVTIHGLVSHWAYATDDEVKTWQRRTQAINDYKYLNIEVDKQHEESVYRALVLASHSMLKIADEMESNSESQLVMKSMASILYDLQSVIDNGKPIGEKIS